MLVKRLESSKYAFLQTIERFIKSYEAFIEMYDSGTIYISNKVDVYEYLENEDIENLLKELEKDDNAKMYPVNHFKPDFIDKLYFDLKILKEIQTNWLKVKKDFKKDEFIRVLKSDSKLKNSKMIIFTESMETGIDLYNSLVQDFNSLVLFYSSGNCRYNSVSISVNTAKELIHQNYDPKNKEQNNDIQILITTDVLAEGINLHRSNIIINYDLPWNPTKVLQRVGRVNRIGTKFDKIYIYNFFPSSTADAELGLENSIKAKIQAFHETLGEDAKYLTEEEETTNHKLFGENFFDRVNDKNTYNEDDLSENLELKYISILENIRENNLDLFNKIKYLPKKARTARKFNSLEKDSLITFFRKGALKKIFITDGETYQDLGFDDAVKYFECSENLKKENLTKTFYDLLQANKDQFYKDSNDTINQELVTTKKKGSSNEREVKLRIEFAIKEGRLTDIQEDFLKQVLQVYEVGSIPLDISKEIKDEISKTMNSLDVYQSVKRHIPNTYLINRKQINKKDTSQREIILSEMLLSQ
jgi:superfamily II DNA/RNA helicase